jgi:16S rRNA (cytosine967-C5)-methyltransferase
VISPARDTALDILLKVEQGAFASELLHSERLDKLTFQDRGLTTELVMGVLRWRSRLDEAIASLASQPLSKLDAEVLESLRLAAYQIGFLARIPAHAAVNDSVELVKRKKKKSAAPFVNAVLRKLLAQKDVLEPVLSPGPKTIPELSVLYAHPLWLVDRWAAQYGLEAADRICVYDQQVPRTVIHIADPAVESELIATGIELAPGRLLRSARTIAGGDVTKTPQFRDGRIQIQDEGSQLVAMLVGRGERLLDCCAAPGGKTAILATRNPESAVVATELHGHRAEMMRERLRGRSNVTVTVADVTRFDVKAEFDRVLADVPCSGTGTLARNPEIKWRLRTEDLADLHGRQVEILKAALGKLRAGGRLVYSTCSLEPEENEGVVHEVVDGSAFRIVPAAEELEALGQEGTLLLGDCSGLTDGPFLRILPGEFGTDGFFAAVIER